MTALAVLAAVTCTVVLLRAFGTRWPWEQVTRPVSAPSPWHWVPTKQSGHIRRALEEHGYYVLTVGAVDGLTALAICDGRTP